MSGSDNARLTPEVLDEDAQPDGIDGQTRDLPALGAAAARVGEYICGMGDGQYDVAVDGSPLFARDLEVLVKHALDEVAAARESTPAPTEALVADAIDSEASLRPHANHSWLAGMADAAKIARSIAARTAPASEVAPTNAEAAWDAACDEFSLYRLATDGGVQKVRDRNPCRADRIEAGA